MDTAGLSLNVNYLQVKWEDYKNELAHKSVAHLL